MDVFKVASYICSRYEQEFGIRIDEMKLHKLLYFVQRESLIQHDKPLFDAPFQAWRYGPVIPEIRSRYKQGTLNEFVSSEEIESFNGIFNKVFEQYASKDAWSLSSITHGEKSWQKARKGIPVWENSDVLIDIEDIRQDAQYIKQRRFLLSKLQSI